MKSHTIPLVAAYSARPFVSALTSKGLDATAVLEAVGLPDPEEDPLRMVPAQSWYDLTEAVAELLEDKHLGYKIGYRSAISSMLHGARLSLEGASLGEVLNAMLSDFQSVATYSRHRLVNDGTWFSIEAKRLFVPLSKPVQIDAYSVGHIVQLVSRFAGPHWDKNHFQASIVDPNGVPENALPRSSLLKTSKRDATIRFPAKWLLYCEGGQSRQTKIKKAWANKGFLNDIRHVIELHVSEPDFTMEELAKLVSVSPDVLQKHFASSGTTFRSELDGIRVALAKKLLGDATTKIADVQSAVGYTDASAFARAFKKWTGCTPSRVRNGAFKNQNTPKS